LRGRERQPTLVSQGNSIAHALGQVAREVTRAAAAYSRDPFPRGPGCDIEDLCDAVVDAWRRRPAR